MSQYFCILIIVSIYVEAQNNTETPPQPISPTTTPGKTIKPNAKAWVHGHLPSNKTGLIHWLLTDCVHQGTPCINTNAEKKKLIEYEGYDGFYNNIAHPELGAVDTPLLRRVAAAYEDGVYKPSGSNRPPPLELSELLKGHLGTQSKTGKTALLVFFGQQVVEEILDAQRAACPPEYFNIPIPENHTYSKKLNHTVMPVLRTRYDARTGFSPNNPRQQLNEITPWLDGGLVYGTTKTWSDQLRTYENGTMDPNGLLASSHDGLFPEYNTVGLPMANPPPPIHHKEIVERHELLPVHRFFKLGNPRGNENAFLLTFGILWFRWHNHIARHLKDLHPDWKGEKIYNEARKWVIATHQHIVVNDWLPKLLGRKLKEYEGYNPAVDPQIDQFFQAAAFRFGHTLVTPGVYFRDYGRNGCNSTVRGWSGKAVRTCNIFWRPQDAIKSQYNYTDEFMDIDRLLMGMAFQLSEEEDHRIVEDLRGSVFGPLEFSRRDLMALNIQRGRDHGLPDFNTVRKAYGLNPVTDWSQFPNSTNEVEDLFIQLYNNSFEDVDLWVGGILETKDGPGELFTEIIKDQFERIRDGDRFWYGNTANNLFSEEEVKRIEQLTIYDIIMSVTKMDSDDIQADPFTALKEEDKASIAENCKKMLSHKSKCKINNITQPCYHLRPLTSDDLENCTPPETYDYFSSSEVSFSVTFLGVGLIVLAFIATMLIMRKLKQKHLTKKITRVESKVRASYKKSDTITMPFAAQERVGQRIPLRHVVIVMNRRQRQMQVLTQSGQLLRALDLSHSEVTTIFKITDGLHIMVRTKNDYDLVLKFNSEYLRESFLQAFESYVTDVGIGRQYITMPLQAALKQAITQKDRQKKLEMFFRVVFAQAFEIPHSEEELLNTDENASKEIIYTEITKTEFAEALSMKRDSEFVEKMFSLVDKDRNGFVSFREFLDMLIIFAKGSPDDKAQLMFDMYDINKTRQLTKNDFKQMIRSLIETVTIDVEEQDLNSIVEDMMTQAGLQHKQKITVSDFQRLLADYKDKLNYTHLNFTGVPGQPGRQSSRSSFVVKAQETVSNLYREPGGSQSQTQVSDTNARYSNLEHMTLQDNLNLTGGKPSKRLAIARLIENYSLRIFWITLYTLVVIAIFAERAYYYSVEREHTGLRRIAGYGVTVTRGAASAMMFTYSTLLLTMCRSTITLLRDTFLHLYIPFDLAVSMHKYIATLALVFTVLHVIGHAFNFYSISTQTADDLTCLFRNYYHASHELPKFSYWCWETITGVTGILLTLLTALIYIFSLPVARRELYNAFWFIHSLYPVFYILMVLHGAGRLIQEPYFHYFFLGPCVLFTVDHMITASRKKVEVPVIKAELLPSNVTMLEFKKPFNFEYKSGQWIRISCPSLNTLEFHPFTLSSAPHQQTLTVHIRAVGPWTTNIRQKYDPTILREKPLPKIHIEGPFGEGHQDWYQFEVAVLVGGGIGVTPFASILKDIVNRVNTNQYTICQKVYFLWVTKTQKQFEWLVDIIREAETRDHKKVVSTHIFITQFYQKYDLRTIMLYICERHFQRICNRSLLTGLQANTDFGRPNFNSILTSVQNAHSKMRKIGVFSCGPPALTQTVDSSCINLNKKTVRGPLFQHHFKNF